MQHRFPSGSTMLFQWYAPLEVFCHLLLSHQHCQAYPGARHACASASDAFMHICDSPSKGCHWPHSYTTSASVAVRFSFFGWQTICHMMSQNTVLLVQVDKDRLTSNESASSSSAASSSWPPGFTHPFQVTTRKPLHCACNTQQLFTH